MGHNRLGELPRTRRFNQVVELIAGGGDAASVSAATLAAIEEALSRAATDVGFTRATWLLTQLPAAARDADYVGRLRQLGIDVDGPPGFSELIGAFSDAVDAQIGETGRRSDVGEMAQMAATEALARVVGEQSRSLFETSGDELRPHLAALATEKQFGSLARDFFAAYVRRHLTFYLSRELPNHVGWQRRFANISEHAEFNAALDLHCRQASRIVEEFAGAWFSKTNWERKGISHQAARGFLHVALKKMRAELRRGA